MSHTADQRGPCKAPGATGGVWQKPRRWGMTGPVIGTGREGFDWKDISPFPADYLEPQTGNWAPRGGQIPTRYVNSEPSTPFVKVEPNQGVDRKTWRKWRPAVVLIFLMLSWFKTWKKRKRDTFRSGRSQCKSGLIKLYICSEQNYNCKCRSVFPSVASCLVDEQYIPFH